MTTWGGTPAEAWTSAAALKTMTDFANVDDIVAQQTAKAKISVDGIALQNTPSMLYNAMVAPLIPYGIKGTIWYQGENNGDRGQQYRTLLPTMIGDWRSRWGEGDFPFYIVSLANWMPVMQLPVDEPWAHLREAQAMTAHNIKNSGLAVTIDIGDTTDVHPKNKEQVGRRLELIASTNSMAGKSNTTALTIQA